MTTIFQLSIQTAEPAHVQIERWLQQRILDSELKPHQRLPSSQDLAREWRVSLSVVQKALRRLSAGGLLERTPGRGTFVRNTTLPPYIGLIVGPNLLDVNTYYFRAVTRELQKGCEERRWRCRIHDDLSRQVLGNDPDYRAPFLDEILNHPYKGFIWVGIRWASAQAELRQRGLPSVCDAPPTFPQLDINSFIQEAVTCLVQQRRRRPLLFCSIGQRSLIWDRFQQSCDRQRILASIETFHQTKLPVGVFTERLVHDQALETIECWKRSDAWPDALVFTDDVCAMWMVQALRERGVAVPDKLLVITLTNDMVAVPYAAPVVQLAYSPRESVRGLLDALWREMLGLPYLATLQHFPFRLRTSSNPSPSDSVLSESYAGICNGIAYASATTGTNG